MLQVLLKVEVTGQAEKSEMAIVLEKIMFINIKNTWCSALYESGGLVVTSKQKR